MTCMMGVITDTCVKAFGRKTFTTKLRTMRRKCSLLEPLAIPMWANQVWSTHCWGRNRSHKTECQKSPQIHASQQKCECIFSHRWAFQKRPDIPSTSKPSTLPGSDWFQGNDVLRIFSGMSACATVQGWFFPARLPGPCKSLWDPFLYHRWALMGITESTESTSLLPQTLNNHQHCPILIDLQCTPKLFLIFTYFTLSLFAKDIPQKTLPPRTK